MKHTWLIDKGHGGMIDGVYQTYPDKMFVHSPNEVFYEGVSNRIIGNLLLKRLRAQGIKAIDLCPTELDLSLDVRVNIANRYHREYHNCVLISLHSNAGGGRGFEVWTSVGQTESDKFADILGEEIMHSFHFPFRADRSDNDIDKESQFYILKNTYCPAILPEFLFFDNYDDYKMITNLTVQERYVDVLVNFILKSELVL